MNKDQVKGRADQVKGQVKEVAGKAVGKDADAGKETFVSLMGVDRAREQARLLTEQAIGALASYGEEADLLRAIARYILDRDH